MVVQYPYLEQEDATFAKAFRLSEDEVLGMFNGLKGYTQHRLDRALARGNDHQVKALPNTIESQMGILKFTDVPEKKLAELLVGQQVTQVKGCLAGIKATGELKAQGERDAHNKAAVKTTRMQQLREESAAMYGWSPDSQSAKDYADTKYHERWEE